MSVPKQHVMTSRVNTSPSVLLLPASATHPVIHSAPGSRLSHDLARPELQITPFLLGTSIDETLHTEEWRGSPGADGSSTMITSECIGERHISGKGIFYVLRDGTVCPTFIDGESTNPSWGTTKIGRSRKRLARVCLYVSTCHPFVHYDPFY
jgi:hypothetical protein